MAVFSHWRTPDELARSFYRREITASVWSFPEPNEFILFINPCTGCGELCYESNYKTSIGEAGTPFVEHVRWNEFWEGTCCRCCQTEWYDDDCTVPSIRLCLCPCTCVFVSIATIAYIPYAITHPLCDKTETSGIASPSGLMKYVSLKRNCCFKNVVSEFDAPFGHVSIKFNGDNGLSPGIATSVCIDGREIGYCPFKQSMIL